MRRFLPVVAVVVSSLLSQAHAAVPSVNFTGLGPHGTFNSLLQDNVTYMGVGVSGFVYKGGTNFTQAEGSLWLRNNANDHGLGYCSEGLSNCTGSSGPSYNYGVNGRGDWNELGNNNKDEVIRLSKSSGKQWTNLWVSSLDNGGSHSNESGIVYWSNVATPDLNALTTFAKINANLLPGDEGSIWTQMTGAGFDVNAGYVFFRADAANGTNNDFLVWGVGVAPVPEPEIYAMLGAGFGLMGFVARRRKQQVAAS